MMQAFVNLEQLQHNSLPIVFNIFNRKTRAAFRALHNFLKLKDGTTILIELISQWFKIMNKKDKNAFIQLIVCFYLVLLIGFENCKWRREKVETKNWQSLLQLNFFSNWDSLHARLNSHYEAWSYKKKKHKKITAKRKSV